MDVFNNLRDASSVNLPPSYLLAENQLNSNENINLYMAALNGDLNQVKSNLKAGAKPNYFYRPEEQKNSLHIAAEKGYLEVLFPPPFYI